MRKTNGFTLIELLVVITIITVLAGLLLPGVMRAMKQAKTNRALSEMQHLATVITQVYSEVGYYVRLEDLAQLDNTKVRRWLSDTSYIAGQSDKEVNNTLSVLPDVHLMWAGPYATYKSFCIPLIATSATADATDYRPIDPWGNSSGDNASKLLRQYRMFWAFNSDYPLNDSKGLVPAGARGAMVIISAGGDGKYQCGITTGTTPANAVQADFDDFNPLSNDKGDDVYYIFNAGIQ